MPAKVLFLALDACDVEEATGLAAAGRMPVLAGLLETARVVHTVGPPVGTYVSGTWPTIVSGVSTDKHGYTCWRTIDPTTGDDRPTSPKDVPIEPFWMRLSDAGRRVALLDLPHTWPAEGLNGVMLCEWGSHDRHFGLDSWPPELAAETLDRFGPQPIGMTEPGPRQFAPCDWVHGGPWGARSLEQAQAFRDDLFTGLERKQAASLDLLASDDWDLFAVVFGESHCVGHQFWYLHDERHDRFDPEHAATLGDPMAEVYTRLDAAVGEHIAAAGDDTDVLVLLSHGMAAHYTGEHLFDAVLLRLAAADAREGNSHGVVRMAKRGWRALPLGVRRKLHPLVARSVRRRASSDDATGAEPGAGAHPSTRPFFPFPNNDTVSAVRINRIRPDGRELTAAEYEEVSNGLVADLLDLVNVGSGAPAVSRVRRGVDVFGSLEHPIADLYVDWNWAHQFNAVYSPKVGLVRDPYRHVRSGDHRPHGLLLATGPDIEPGTTPEVVGLEHVAPTIAGLLGVELPDAAGQPLPGIGAAVAPGAPR